MIFSQGIPQDTNGGCRYCHCYACYHTAGAAIITVLLSHCQLLLSLLHVIVVVLAVAVGA